MKEQPVCARCNKQVKMVNKEHNLCDRCQDVIEFGYPSFPPYKLEEEKVLVKI
jgi:hypothetical protein